MREGQGEKSEKEGEDERGKEGWRGSVGHSDWNQELRGKGGERSDDCFDS